MAVVHSKPTDDTLLKAVEQLTLTVASLKDEVQHLHMKHGYLAHRLESGTERTFPRDGRHGSSSTSPS